jgi:Uma2 family endonuclease
VTFQHDRLTHYLDVLFQTYFELKPIGQVVAAPFVMRLEAIDSAREPDLQIILQTRMGELTATYMNGPADICIEVVSPESISRDHGAKFEEYERGGVHEYWIIDPVHQECRFYRLGEAGRYARQAEDAQGNYRTPALPQFALHVPTLWSEKLPGPLAVAEAVRAMLAGKEDTLG